MSNRWREAGEIAFRAMGTKKLGKNIVHLADEDPLAWWCLTEWIYNYGQRGRRSPLEGLSNEQQNES